MKMSSEKEKANKAVKDFVQFMKFDARKEFDVVSNTVDEMLTRCDEFENSLALVRAEQDSFMADCLPEMISQHAQVLELCKKIDSLEKLVGRVDSDLRKVETAASNAEADLETPSTQRLSSMLKPFFKTETDPGPKKMARQTPSVDQDAIYNTDQIFPQSSSE